LRELVADLKRIPHAINELTERSTTTIDEIAERIQREEFFLYLGRHVGLAVCLEGALKLKEISYISTDAYAAGEMKHGPIALLHEGTPVVVVATNSARTRQSHLQHARSPRPRSPRRRR
jgi:glucosamine--fructose-6-phosphate aminotransferase (isomerizing)